MPAVVREAAVGDTAVGIAITVCAEPAWAVVFRSFVASVTIGFAAGIALRSHAHTIANCYTFPSLVSYSDGCADDLVANAAGVYRCALEIKTSVSDAASSRRWE